MNGGGFQQSPAFSSFLSFLFLISISHSYFTFFQNNKWQIFFIIYARINLSPIRRIRSKKFKRQKVPQNQKELAKAGEIPAKGI